MLLAAISLFIELHTFLLLDSFQRFVYVLSLIFDCDFQQLGGLSDPESFAVRDVGDILEDIMLVLLAFVDYELLSNVEDVHS